MSKRGGRVTFPVADKFHPAPCHVNNERSLIVMESREREDYRNSDVKSKQEMLNPEWNKQTVFCSVMVVTSI